MSTSRFAAWIMASPMARNVTVGTAAGFVGGGIVAYFDYSYMKEQKRIIEWQKCNPGKEYEMAFKPMAGTAGHWYPAEKKVTDQQPNAARVKSVVESGGPHL